MAAVPADALRAQTPFLAPHRARVDTVAQRQRIEAELVGQLVDRLLHGKGARRVAGTAHRRAAAGIDEHVALRRGEVRAGVQRLGEVADAGADAHARRAVFQQGDRGQRAVAARADAQVLPGGRAIAGVELLLLPIEHQPHRRPRLTRQHDGMAAIRPELGLRAEAAAHRGDLHPHLAELQAKALRQFVAHADGELGGHPDGQAIRPPVGDDRVRLHAAMGLRLRAIGAFDHHLGLAEALRAVAAAALGFRAAHVAGQLHVGRDRDLGQRQRGRLAGRIHQRRGRLARGVRIDDEGQRRIVDTDQAQRGLRRRRRPRRDRRDGSADVAQDGVFRRDDQDGAHARLARGGRGLDGAHPRVRPGRAQDARVQQSGQLDVHGEPHGAGDLGARVLSRHRLADHLQRGVHRQRRRFVDRDASLDRAHSDTGDAERKTLGPQRVGFHGQVFRAVPAACMAASTCG